MSNESITDCRDCTSWLLDVRGYKGNTGESGICLISGMPHSCYPLTPCEAGTRKVQPKKGDIIQTGMIFANGDGSIHWSTHQVVRRVSYDGTLWYRPREGKVDKTPQYWRFPVESREEIIKDLKCWANPVEGKEAIKRLLGGAP